MKNELLQDWVKDVYYPMPKNPTYDEWRKWQMEVGVKLRTGNPNAVIVEPLSSEYEEYLKASYEDYIDWIGKYERRNYGD